MSDQLYQVLLWIGFFAVVFLLGAAVEHGMSLSWGVVKRRLAFIVIPVLSVAAFVIMCFLITS